MSKNYDLPNKPPVQGGWYYDEKFDAPRFLMPPYPGVDDCIKVNGQWCYRKLIDRQECIECGCEPGDGDKCPVPWCNSRMSR